MVGKWLVKSKISGENKSVRHYFDEGKNEEKVEIKGLDLCKLNRLLKTLVIVEKGCG